MLAAYRPLRAAIRRVLAKAPAACTRADWMRAAKLIGAERDGEVVLDGEEEMEFLADIALFEPNTRRNRAYDRFLRGAAADLAPDDQDIARRMGEAFFSVFRVAGRHEAAGLWLEDLLQGDRRFWLMDEGLEASATPGIALAARIFDAGPFHAGFGIFIPLEDEAASAYVRTVRRTGKPPMGTRFAAFLYGAEIQTRALAGLVEDLLDLAKPPRPGGRRARKAVRGKRAKGGTD